MTEQLTEAQKAEQAALLLQRRLLKADADAKTLDWMDQVCGAAFKEGRGGNTALLNHLGKNKSLEFYIINVTTRGVLTREQFAQQYPGLLAEANQLRLDYETLAEAKEDHQTVNTLTEQLDQLKTQLAAQAEQIKALEAAQKPGAKKKPAEADAE